MPLGLTGEGDPQAAGTSKQRRLHVVEILSDSARHNAGQGRLRHGE